MTLRAIRASPDAKDCMPRVLGDINGDCRFDQNDAFVIEYHIKVGPASYCPSRHSACLHLTFPLPLIYLDLLLAAAA